jgi:hypothetical protein
MMIIFKVLGLFYVKWIKSRYICTKNVLMTALSIEQIKEQFPDQWVLIGNPETFGSKVLSGFVIFNTLDKREIAYSQVNWREQFQTAITVFTGQMPKNRKFWL